MNVDLDILLAIIDRRLVEDPDVSLREFRDSFCEGLAVLVANRERALCRGCGKDIYQHEDGRWHHDDPSGSRGCYAATWREGEGWDESVNRKSYARP